MADLGIEEKILKDYDTKEILERYDYLTTEEYDSNSIMIFIDDAVVRGITRRPQQAADFNKLLQRLLKFVSVGYLRKSIIDKFAEYPKCDLSLFVAPRFPNLRTYHEPETGTVLWVFERMKDGLHLVPAQTKKAQNMSARKHAIILDIRTTFGLEAEKKLKEIITKY